ncbi:hypothetical protein D021_2282A, partial [Vibrio parahaemolyticus 10296]
MIKFT